MAVLLLLEHDVTFYPVVDSLRERIPGSTIVHWQRYDVKGLESILRTQPVLARSYLVLFEGAPKQDNLKLVKAYGKHTYVFKANAAKTLDEFKATLAENEVPFSVIDNFNKTKEECLGFIMSELQVTESVAKSIYSRSRGYVPRIVENVNFLRLLPSVGAKEVRLYVPRGRQASFDDLFLHVATVRRLSDTAIFELLQYYQNGHRFMAKFLFKKAQLWLQVFQDMESLVLTYANYEEYYGENKRALGMSLKQFQRVMSAYEEVSVDFLYLLCVRLSRLCSDFTESAFLNLLDGGGIRK